MQTDFINALEIKITFFTQDLHNPYCKHAQHTFRLLLLCPVNLMAFTAVAPLMAAASQQKASLQEQLPENVKKQLQSYKGSETKVKLIPTRLQVEK